MTVSKSMESLEKEFGALLAASGASVFEVLGCSPDGEDESQVIVEVDPDQCDVGHLRNLLPSSSEGTPVSVVASETDAEPVDAYDRATILQPGLSISSRRSTSGTLGAIVSYRGAPHILSNRHVLIRGWRLDERRFDVFQPSRIAMGRNNRNIVATLIHRPRRGLDCALARLNEEREFQTDALHTGFKLTSIRDPEVGDVLEKVGARTGVTQARVVSVNQTSVRLEPLQPGVEVSKSGDSGAVWYHPGTGEGAVLHTWGDGDRDTQREWASGLRMSRVKAALGFDFQD